MEKDAATNRVLFPSGSLKGVLFDVDGTLYSQFPLRIIMAGLLVAHHILSPQEFCRRLKIITSYRRAQDELRHLHLKHRRYPEEQIRLVVEETGEKKEYIVETVTTWFEKKPLPYLSWCRRRGVLAVVKELSRKNVKLGVLSDYPAREKLRALEIDTCFPVVVTPGDQEVTGFKPGGNGFLVAAEKMGLQPSEVLYVGDRPEVDGAGAARAGMPVVLIGGAGGISGKNAGAYPTIQRFSDLLDFMERGV